jgi:hypothetical protein
MQIVTTYDNEGLRLLHRIPVRILARQCEVCKIKVVIHNGIITEATQVHRDYVSVHDGRNMYGKSNSSKQETKRVINSIYGACV